MILAENATTGGNAKHQLPIAWKSDAPAAAQSIPDIYFCVSGRLKAIT